MLETRNVVCPYCGETFETIVDLLAGDQTYVEDCHICCRPIEFALTVEYGDTATLEVKRDDE